MPRTKNNNNPGHVATTKEIDTMNLAEYKDNPFTFPGGYQVNAIMGDGERMCHECIMNEDEVFEVDTSPLFYNEDLQWQFIGTEIYWEGPDDNCSNCNRVLASEYGDPAEQDIEEIEEGVLAYSY